MVKSFRFLSLGVLFLLPFASAGSTALAQTEDHAQHTEPSSESATPPKHGAHRNHLATGPSDCSEMEVWDLSFGMCMPLPMQGMAMQMLMIHGNAFGVYSNGSGPRGRSGYSSPNMLMTDIGTTLGGSHYLDLNLMLTAEKWTFPTRGYPELMQIGERDRDGNPYIDAQHPHSSPIMGLTLSDTIRLSTDSKDHLKIFFAPRGQSTDGPVAFMHRPTGMVNPDAPLSHHIGQDVGHITSTVLGGSLLWGRTRIEASVFNGTEPEPDEVNLPLGRLNSYAFRLGYDFSDSFTVLASLAHLKDPEPHGTSFNQMRHSVSAYTQHSVGSNWKLHQALIHGAIDNSNQESMLNSFTYEFWLNRDRPSFWGRAELLQRTPSELQISNVSEPNKGRWVGALTLGYSYLLHSIGSTRIQLGVSGTKGLLPGEYIGAYGGNPWTGKVFLQVGGMGMWDL